MANPWDMNLKNNFFANPYNMGGVKPRAAETGTSTTTGHVASAGGQFDWRSLNKFDNSLTGNVTSAPSGASSGEVVSSPIQFAGTKTVNPATEAAKSGDMGLQQRLAGIGRGELTPAVGAYNNNWMQDFYA